MRDHLSLGRQLFVPFGLPYPETPTRQTPDTCRFDGVIHATWHRPVQRASPSAANIGCSMTGMIRIAMACRTPGNYTGWISVNVLDLARVSTALVGNLAWRVATWSQAVTST